MPATDNRVKDDLRRQASRLYRFVSRLRDLVREARGVCTYPPDSKQFLNFVIDVAEQTFRFLDKLSLQEATTVEHREILHGKIADLEGAWALLHQFVKPVVDADSLHVPEPVVSLVRRSAQAVLKKHADDPVLAIKVLSELNFVQVRQFSLLEIEKQIREAMGSEYPVGLPGGLGILGVPYSHGPALFMNSLLFHELGHYVFERWEKEETDLRAYLLKQVRPAIISHFPTLKNDKTCFDAMFEFILPWWEEVFCDLFAVRAVGPVFTCLLWELLNVTGAIRAEKADLFHPNHPSDKFRFGEQVMLLDKLKWSDALCGVDIDVLASIKRDLGISEGEKEHEIPERPYDPDFLAKDFPDTPVRVFRDGLRAVRGLVDEVTEHSAGSPDQDFRNEYKKICQCLEHGIVPSTLYPCRPSSPNRVVTLLNSAYFFQLSPMGGLFSIVRDAKKESVADNARLRQRVEEWTLKAISDLLQHS